MIGRIVVGLLAVFCFSCIVTEAQFIRRQFPKFNTSIVDDCGLYIPVASFDDIKGNSSVEEVTADPKNCLSLLISDAEPGFPDSGAYNFDYNYVDSTGPEQLQALLIRDPYKSGRAQLFSTGFEENTVTFSVTRLIATVVLSGYKNGTDGFDGYALVFCPIPVGDKQVLIALSDKLSQDAVVSVVSDLKAQVNATGLGGVKLYVINHTSC